MNPRFVILSPCSRRWDELEGEGRERHCATCNTPVHAIDEYSPAEWMQVWATNGGHVCGFRAASFVALPRTRRAMLLGALLTLASPLFAQSAKLRIRVTDFDGVVIPGAAVELRRGEGLLKRAETNSAGEVIWTELPRGEFILNVTSEGFMPYRTMIDTPRHRDKLVNITLLVPVVGLIVDVPPKRKRWWKIW